MAGCEKKAKGKGPDKGEQRLVTISEGPLGSGDRPAGATAGPMRRVGGIKGALMDTVRAW